MKKINAINILVLNIIILLIVFNFYKSSSSDIVSTKNYFIETQKVYTTYKNSKESLYVKKDVEKILRKIARNLNIKNINIVARGKKLIVNVENITLQKQDKFLNKVFNEKFIILKCQIEKNITKLELGLK